MIGNMRIKEI